jgi:hypothetical protein
METIFEMWGDIGMSCVKFFKENMYSEIETSYLYHILEEIITKHEETILDDGFRWKRIGGRGNDLSNPALGSARLNVSDCLGFPKSQIPQKLLPSRVQQT